MSHSTSLLWMAPALSGGGYASEAIAFAQGLEKLLGDRFSLKQFAEPPSEDFLSTVSEHPQFRLLQRWLHRAESPRASSGVVVCHSTPDAWVPSKFKGWDDIAPCPPPSARFAIGRTMYETDALPSGWAERCNNLDEIWVPTEAAATSFATAGVLPEKLVVVGEPVDTVFFDPQRVEPLALPMLAGQASAPPPFRFLSVFKWELRKGWDVLLSAYYAEFGADEPVELVLKTAPFHSSADFEGLIADWVRARGLPARRPHVRILGHELAPSALPALYRAANAFVLPSRGEGWGRPHVEAMAMGLPVIATNATGPTAYLDETVGYPLPFALEPVAAELQLPGHRWAEPSLPDLRQLMRHVFVQREEARERGQAARERMRSRFSPEALAEEVDSHLERLASRLHGDGKAGRRRRRPRVTKQEL